MAQRARPRTEADRVRRGLIVCDQCDEDYEAVERACVRVAVPIIIGDREIVGETICRNCLAELGVTGCNYRGGYPVFDPAGTDEPPEYDWPHRQPSCEETLEYLQGFPFATAREGSGLGPLDPAGALAALRGLTRHTP